MQATASVYVVLLCCKNLILQTQLKRQTSVLVRAASNDAHRNNIGSCKNRVTDISMWHL